MPRSCKRRNKISGFSVCATVWFGSLISISRSIESQLDVSSRRRFVLGKREGDGSFAVSIAYFCPINSASESIEANKNAGNKSNGNMKSENPPPDAQTRWEKREC